MRTLVVAALLAIAAACTPAPTAQTGIIVEDAWITPTPAGAELTAGYLTLRNNSAQDDRLISARSERATRIELHDMIMNGGVMQMRPLEAMPVPAGGEARFAPGGAHLMIYVDAPLSDGDTVPVVLVFESAGEMTTEVPVRRGGAQAHGEH